jgi:hypothetical protein
VITVPPQVTTFAPDQGLVGTELTIRGSGFGANRSVVKVTLAGQPLDVVSVRDDTLIARLPPAARTGRLKVEIPLQGAAQSDRDFTVLADPVAAPVVPAPIAPAASPAQPKKR